MSLTKVSSFAAVLVCVAAVPAFAVPLPVPAPDGPQLWRFVGHKHDDNDRDRDDRGAARQMPNKAAQKQHGGKHHHDHDD